MDNRLKIIKLLFALAAIIALLAITETPNVNKSSSTTFDKEGDLEAVCVTVVMGVY